MLHTTHTKQTIQLANHLVSCYAKYDRLSACYTLSIYDIPDFDLHKLAACLLAENDVAAQEATGPDNPNYTKTMLPALIKFMRNTTDADTRIEFASAWADGITNFTEDAMASLLAEELDAYNDERGHFNNEEPTLHRYTGETSSIWAD